MANFYDAIFEEYGVEGLDSDNLDGAWLSAYERHQEAIADGKLTDQQITEAEEGLIELFKKLQPEIEEDDSPDPKTEEELRKLRNQNLYLQAEKDVNAAKDMATLEKLKETYKDHSDAMKLIDDRLLTMGAAIESQRRDKVKHTISESLDLDVLNKIQGEWANDKDISKLVKARIKDVTAELETQKVQKTKQSVIETLKSAHGKDVSYDWLRKLGIEPTDDHMEVEGIRLLRVRFFYAYRIEVPENLRG